MSRIMKMTRREFLNVPTVADAPMLRELAALHVGPGEKFDDKALGLFSGLHWKLMLLQMKKKLQSESKRYTRQMGQGTYFDVDSTATRTARSISFFPKKHRRIRPTGCR